MGCSAGKYEEPQEDKTKWNHDFESKFPPLEGKVFCVTLGCTDGMGYACARAAACKGAHVVMLSPCSVAAETSLAEQVPGAKVTSIPCDLHSFDSLLAAVATLKKKFSKTGIDVLFNCADVMALTDRATAEQERHSLQLVHFVLTAELRPLLELATLMRGRARVVTVKHSSVAPEMPSKQLDAACLGNNNGNNNSNNNSNKNNSNNTRIKVVVFALGMGGRITTSSCKVKCVGVSVGFDPTTTNNDILYLTNKLKDAMPSTCKVKSVCAAPGFDATTNDKNKNNNNKQVTRNSQDAMPSTWTRKSAPSAQELKLESICPKPETVKI